MSLTLFCRHPNTLSLLREMDAIWEDIDSPQNASRNQSKLVPRMNCDVTETKDKFTVHAELPGVSKESINVQVDKNVLTIQAVKEDKRVEDSDTHHLRERRYGKVSRSFQLPTGINLDSSKCAFENGELIISFDKNPEMVSRKLEIQ